MNTQHTNAAETKPGRDDNGRFIAGNKGGPGNPFARKVAALRQALIESVTPQDIQDVAARLLALAKEGNVQAIKLLLAYAIGKPQPAPEPDRMDADEWEVYQETTPMKQQAAALISAGTPDFHLHCVRTTRPVTTFLMQKQLEGVVNETPEQVKERQAAENAERLFNMLTARPEGAIGAKDPSPNGKKRPAPKAPDRFEPSTNGAAHHAACP